MSKLSQAEERIMKVIWKKPKTYMKDILESGGSDKPTTIATLLKRMKEKGFIDYEKHGNVRAYFPLVSKAKYFKKQLGELIENHFDNSATQFASFFTEEIQMTDTQLKELRDMIDQQLNTEEE